MPAAIKAIEYHLPEKVLKNSELSESFPEWPVAKIEGKTGIVERRIAAQDECSSDLAVAAARKLFATGVVTPDQIDYLLLCTQTPDYFLPTTACLVQRQLDIPRTAGALDFNLGCSGFVYGLGLAKGLIETGQAHRILLITAETYTKLIHDGDKSVRTIFGDAAAATLIEEIPAPDGSHTWIGPFITGTDGRGAENLIVPVGGMRLRRPVEPVELKKDVHGNTRTIENLYMNGGEIFTFTLECVPGCVEALLKKSGKALDDIDLYVFHQANQYMLENLRKRIGIPAEKFFVSMRHCGNTVSSTIPIALKHAEKEGRLKSGQLVMLVGFGVGYSWGATLVRWI